MAALLSGPQRFSGAAGRLPPLALQNQDDAFMIAVGKRLHASLSWPM